MCRALYSGCARAGGGDVIIPNLGSEGGGGGAEEAFSQWFCNINSKATTTIGGGRHRRVSFCRWPRCVCKRGRSLGLKNENVIVLTFSPNYYVHVSLSRALDEVLPRLMMIHSSSSFSENPHCRCNNNGHGNTTTNKPGGGHRVTRVNKAHQSNMSSPDDSHHHLPPLPKLRPRPGLNHHEAVTIPASARGHRRAQQQQHQRQQQRHHQRHDPDVTEQQQQQSEVITDETTSRLLMKSECKGGSGRRKNTGSLVHSIPKFSQVKPNERLTEVQKVLQSRILAKKHQQQMMQHQERTTQHHPVPFSSTTTSSKSSTACSNGLQAANLLQNIITFHEQNSSTTSVTTASSTSVRPNKPISQKRRGRKPAKEEICHVVKQQRNSSRIQDDDEEEEEEEAIDPPVHSSSSSYLPRLSEVTITPTNSTSDSALDLRKDRPRSPSPEVIEIPVDPSRITVPSSRSHPLTPPAVMHPSDYERLGMPLGYIYCPRTNMFLHPSVLSQQQQQQSLPQQQQPQQQQQQHLLVPKKQRVQDSFQSLQGVMRVRPQRPAMTSEAQHHQQQITRKRKSTPSHSDPNNEVRIRNFSQAILNLISSTWSLFDFSAVALSRKTKTLRKIAIRKKGKYRKCRTFAEKELFLTSFQFSGKRLPLFIFV